MMRESVEEIASELLAQCPWERYPAMDVEFLPTLHKMIAADLLSERHKGFQRGFQQGIEAAALSVENDINILADPDDHVILENAAHGIRAIRFPEEEQS